MITSSHLRFRDLEFVFVDIVDILVMSKSHGFYNCKNRYELPISGRNHASNDGRFRRRHRSSIAATQLQRVSTPIGFISLKLSDTERRLQHRELLGVLRSSETFPALLGVPAIHHTHREK